MTLDSFLSFLEGKTIHIIGITGAEGSSIAAFLLQQHVDHIIGHDYIDASECEHHFFSYHDWMSMEEKQSAYQKLRSSSITFHFQDTYLQDIGENDIIFVPQSWFRYDFNAPLQHYFEPTHRVKKKYEDRIWSLSKLYLHLFPGTIIAVTGSNGKSTTTALIGHILKTAFTEENRTLFWGGNDRKNDQPLSHLATASSADVLLLELSNRQLVFGLQKSPHIAVITNIVPNHLDDHGTFEQYIAAKTEILRYQEEGDIAVLNSDDDVIRSLDIDICSDPLFFGFTPQKQNGLYVLGEDIVVREGKKKKKMIKRSDIHLPGEHNVLNVLAALGATLSFSIPKEKILQALATFRGLEYRIEYVDTVRGVSYYDDSAGCNPQNIKAAIDAFSSPLIVIAGGYRKNPLPGEFTETAQACKKEHVKKIILIGSIQDIIKKELLSNGVVPDKIMQQSTLQDAVLTASSLATEGDSVVLSPGCESFGEFTDYRDRGTKFKTLVRSLPR
jgi:UDP-N-acetylmuramoylalanine--D-glutamate ligase